MNAQIISSQDTLITSKPKIAGAFLGTVAEYYDYSLYAYSASIIASKFFEKSDDLTALIKVFGVYAIGYVSKPIGSIIFSTIGDKYGRKIALNTTVIGIAIPTAIIGILPDYAQIGAMSTVILVLCRFFQSIFVAGEYDGAAIYVIEHFARDRSYTASGITRSMCALGLVLGSAIVNICSSSIFPEWGWRVPFLLSVPVLLATLYFRSKLSETPDFEKSKSGKMRLDNSSIIDVFKRNWVNIVKLIILAGGIGVTYQISVVFVNQYFPMVLPETKGVMGVVSTLLIFFYGVGLFFSGILADRVGPTIVVKVGLVLSVAFILTMGLSIYANFVNIALLSSVFLVICISPFNGLAHGVATKIFGVDERYRCISIGHTVGSMLMSGTANYVCLLFVKNFDFKLFPLVYVGTFAILCYVVFLNVVSLNLRPRDEK